MKTRLGVENRNLNSFYQTNAARQKQDNISKEKDINFQGAGIGSALLFAIQECERNPMINVAVIDMFSAILPRTFVESMTNWFAGFEAFRRESSGLIVNCLIPGVITLGVATGLNKFIMPKNVKMAGCWADHSLIDKATSLYSKSNANDKIKDSFREILANIEGTHGGKPKPNVIFKEILSEEEIIKYADKLKELTTSNLKSKDISKEIEKIAKEIAEKTHVYENIKINGSKDVKASTVKSLLDDTVKYFKEFQKVDKHISIEEFAKQSKKLVKGKSILGLAIILPLAASMQYINRWITKKISGVDGAPIYEDFGKEQNEEVRKKSQEGLLKQKIISISSMIGVSLLSMMKKPTWSMLEFKGLFPTMDQARVISTTTFASRMAVADDKNELSEATIRDIATFSGLYFLGDYAGKAAATLVQKKKGIELLNDTNPLKEDAGVLKRFWHWVKDVNIKSSEEVVSKTKEALKGAKPTKEQEAIIAKELKDAVNWRSGCQVANLGVSLILLGLIVPLWTRRSTKKKHAEALMQMQEANSDKGIDVNNKSLELQKAQV